VFNNDCSKLILAPSDQATAIDTSHGVQQEDEESPQRDELKTPLGKLIVAGCGLMAPGANRRRTFARTQTWYEYTLIVALRDLSN
jgi:hypothetical protein